MATVTLTQLCTAIASVLDDAIASSVTQEPDELTEGINDTPLLQVYPEGSTGTRRLTFGPDLIRVTDITLHVDYYATRRSNVADDMEVLLPGIDAIVTYLESQKTGDLFAQNAIKQITWKWERVQFQVAQASYMGARFVLEVIVF